MPKKLKVVVVFEGEYTPEPGCYPSGAQLADMAKIDLSEIDRDPIPSVEAMIGSGILRHKVTVEPILT